MFERPAMKQDILPQFISKMEYTPIFPDLQKGQIKGIMILGKTRSGKSTLFQLLSGRSLQPKKQADGSWHFIDPQSPTKSCMKGGVDSYTHEPNIKKYMPKQNSKNKTSNIYFIDNPGTKDQSYLKRLYNSYFIGQVVKKLDKMHLCVVINYLNLERTQIVMLKQIKKMFPESGNHITLFVNNVNIENTPKLQDKIKTEIINLLQAADKQSGIDSEGLLKYYQKALSSKIHNTFSIINLPNKQSYQIRAEQILNFIQDGNQQSYQSLSNKSFSNIFTHADISDGSDAIHKDKFQKEMGDIQKVLKKCNKKKKQIIQDYGKQTQQIVNPIEQFNKNKQIKKLKTKNIAPEQSQQTTIQNTNINQHIENFQWFYSDNLCLEKMNAQQTFIYFQRIFLKSFQFSQKLLNQFDSKFGQKTDTIQNIQILQTYITKILYLIGALKSWMSNAFNQDGTRRILTKDILRKLVLKKYGKKLKEFRNYFNAVKQIMEVTSDSSNSKLDIVKSINETLKKQLDDYHIDCKQKLRFMKKDKQIKNIFFLFSNLPEKRVKQFIEEGKTSNIEFTKISECCYKTKEQPNFHIEMDIKLINSLIILLKKSNKLSAQQLKLCQSKKKQLANINDRLNKIISIRRLMQTQITQNNLNDFVELDKQSQKQGILPIQCMNKFNKLNSLKLAKYHEKLLPKNRLQCLKYYKKLGYPVRIEKLLLSQQIFPCEMNNFRIFIEYGNYFKQLKMTETAMRMYYRAKQCNTQFLEKKTEQVQKKLIKLQINRHRV